MPDKFDAELIELFQLYLDDSLNEPQAERLNHALREDAAARDSFVSFFLQAQLLKEMLSDVDDSAELEKPEKESTASRRAVRTWIPVIGLAASLLIAIAIWRPWLRIQDQPQQQERIASSWEITPTGDAQFEQINPSLIRLDRGELLIESRSGQKKHPLRIVTPSGEAKANGTSFYIGAHQNPTDKEKQMFNPITRVFVLGGAVTLLTSAGSIEGFQGDLLSAKADQNPVKITVKSNSDFAFDLYRRLANENKNNNLFFSPYSISGALAMTAEGARGNTAKEMGQVLRFPSECARVGKDAQLIPWRTSLLHNGYATLNERLHSSQLNPRYAETVKKIDKLEMEYRLLDAKAAKLSNQLFGFGFGDDAPDDSARLKKEFEAASQQRDKLGQEIELLSKQISLYEIRVANAIWGEKTHPFRKSFVETISNHYKTGGMYSVDFRNEFGAARDKINDWCAKQTNGRIKEILPPMSPAQASRMRIVLTNAIFFKADWQTPFEKKLTRPLEFTMANGDKIKTPIMRSSELRVGYGAFNADGSFFKTPIHAKATQKDGLYPDAGGFAIAELPYRGNEVSMLIISPNRHDGLEEIEKKLDSASLFRWTKQLKSREANIFLPRFKQETSYDLKKTLVGMGMKSAFDAGLADFSGMSESANEPIYLGFVKHKAFLDVNEAGTEAAAATVVGGMLGGAPPLPKFIPEFRADRPFLYVIRDVASGTILFMGRMTVPATR